MDRAARIAHRPHLAGSTGCGWLMLAAEMAGLVIGDWRSPPDPALDRLGLPAADRHARARS